MEFENIKEESKVSPGEYLLYMPTQEIVMCGAYRPAIGKIKAFSNGRLMEDKIENFQKIKLDKKERKIRRRKRCGSCKK
tara:strand:- start:187 stop:423 length:237 start_codon:yes stop_codon:yes gene_type:complete